LIAHAVLAVPGITGIEFGAGFAGSKMRGSAYNDVPINQQGKTRTNHSGGTNGGITNGNELVFRVAVKPPSSIRREQESVNLRTGLPVRFSVPGRHDACIALRMPVIIEAAAAVVLADLMLRQQLLSRIAR
jgi:chorismate synthase